jgi:hypothetical protein
VSPRFATTPKSIRIKHTCAISSDIQDARRFQKTVSLQHPLSNLSRPLPNGIDTLLSSGYGFLPIPFHDEVTCITYNRATRSRPRCPPSLRCAASASTYTGHSSDASCWSASMLLQDQRLLHYQHTTIAASCAGVANNVEILV